MVDAATQNQDVQVKHYFPIDRYLNVHQPDLEVSSLLSVKENKYFCSAQDESLLRNLQKLLQSTAEELQVLSYQLTKHSEQAAAQRLPNTDFEVRKNRARMIVDAKFHGVKSETKPSELNKQEEMSKPKDNTAKVSSKKSQTVKMKKKSVKSVDLLFRKDGKSRNVSVQTSSMKEDTERHPHTKGKGTDNKNKESVLPPTVNVNKKEEMDNPMKQFMVNEKYINDKKISIGYVEILKGDEDTKSDNNETVKKFNKLEIQAMPSVNIKTELTAQKIPSIEIKPSEKEIVSKTKISNTAIIEYQHVDPVKRDPQNVNVCQISPEPHHGRKVETNKIEETDLTISQGNVVKLYKEAFDFLQKSQLKEEKEITDSRKKNCKQVRTIHQVISDKWKTKRKQLHSTTSTSELNKEQKSKAVSNSVPSTNVIRNQLTGTEYIPYSRLTLGGVKVNEIEKELLFVSGNKGDIPLSPIVDKILSSADNSMSSDLMGESKMSQQKTSMSTSDENLLQEVLSLGEDIKKTIQEYSEKSDEQSKSIRKNEITSKTFTKSISTSDSEKTNHTYDDDFEEQIEGSQNDSIIIKDGNEPRQKHTNSENGSSSSVDLIECNPDNFSKSINNLSLKNNVDIFEFLHSVATRDTATQIRANNTISINGTQTTPREDNVELHIVPNIATKTKCVSFDDDYIKNLVREECGNFASVSKEIALLSKSTETENFSVVKNIQTSPMHVKHTMTSPMRVANKSTSPFDIISDNSRKITKNEFREDVISLDLSSPRFQLKLPQSSHEVLSNLNSAASKLSLDEKKTKPSSKHHESLHTENRKVTKTSSDSCQDASVSDISSLGEVNFKLLRRKLSRKNRIETTSESSTTSTAGSDSELLRERVRQKTRSDGELSLGQL